MKAEEIEFAVARYFSWRRNVIVPNVSWGMGFRHELDLLVLTPAGYAYEVEIKTTLSDVIADKKKKKWSIYLPYDGNRISRFYFALPENIYAKSIAHIPATAGILRIREVSNGGPLCCTKEREAKRNPNAQKFTTKERLDLYRLAHMRVWSMKEKLIAQNGG
ncbi:MAG: MmcB family DNA repair protein [Deltaproteobacteria bacterium]|nr:MmcB family DNA repair protein [Deltaproteobacteria bacterium]